MKTTLTKEQFIAKYLEVYPIHWFKFDLRKGLNGSRDSKRHSLYDAQFTGIGSPRLVEYDEEKATALRLKAAKKAWKETPERELVSPYRFSGIAPGTVLILPNGDRHTV